MIKFDGKEIKGFATDEPLVMYPNDLIFATLKISNEPFDVYIQKKDIERLKSVFDSKS